MNDLLQINVKKIGALFLCFCLLVMIGPPVLRLLPMEIMLHYLSLFLMILVFTLSYMQRQLVFTKQRYILAFLFFLLGVSFGLPVGGHSWTAKIFLPLLTSVFIVFFDNQVYYITFDYFHDKRERILMSRASWPSMLGYWGSKPWSNIGEVENQGFELSLNWTKQFGKDLTLDLRGNFTYNQNEYKYVDEPSYPYVWQTNTGKPLNTVKGYIAEGLFASEEEIANSPDQSQLGANIMPGDIKYRDINGDGQITTEDQVMISSYDWHPRIQYGFGLNIVYKNFDLGVFFNGSAKRKIMINSGIAPFLSGGGDGEEAETLARNLMQWIADDHWSVDNPNPNAAYPRLGLTKADVTNNVQPSTFWLRNGNFLRFKTLEIGYRLPYCRIYLSGDNLAVFSPFKLWDPELAWNAYPLSRTFNLGVQFTF